MTPIGNLMMCITVLTRNLRPCGLSAPNHSGTESDGVRPDGDHNFVLRLCKDLVTEVLTSWFIRAVLSLRVTKRAYSLSSVGAAAGLLFEMRMFAGLTLLVQLSVNQKRVISSCCFGSTN